MHTDVRVAESFGQAEPAAEVRADTAAAGMAADIPAEDTAAADKAAHMAAAADTAEAGKDMWGICTS